MDWASQMAIAQMISESVPAGVRALCSLPFFLALCGAFGRWALQILTPALIALYAAFLWGL